MLLKILRAVTGTFGGNEEPPATSCALSALNDHLMKDIGVSRLEIDFGHLAPADRCCLASSMKTGTPGA
ncbi:DUF1127 domain-containing protein [Rhizobium sp. SEMIA 4085]|nr:DUF1127 domain-containing protein [Rhizobium sp. SEMIA 4085]